MIMIMMMLMMMIMMMMIMIMMIMMMIMTLYLNSQIKSCTDSVNKRSADHDREKSLIRQWIFLAEERNAVLAPGEDSGVPGAPSSKHIGPGIEAHIPTLFLDLSADDLACAEAAPAGSSVRL